MVKPALLVNGMPLDRWTVTTGTFYRPPVSVNRSLVEIPGVHGATTLGLPVFSEPTVPLSFAPAPTVAGSVAGLESMVDDLLGLLASARLQLTRTTDHRTEIADAALVSISHDEQFQWGQFAKVQASLALPGVFFRDETPTVADLGAPGTHDMQSGSGPVNDAVVRFTGPLSTVSITDQEAGTGLTWSTSSALTSGQYLYLSPGSWSAWVSSSSAAWDGAGTVATSGLGHPPPGPLQLWPGTEMVGASAIIPLMIPFVIGDSTVVSRATRVTTVGAPAAVSYRRAWL